MSKLQALMNTRKHLHNQATALEDGLHRLGFADARPVRILIYIEADGGKQITFNSKEDQDKLSHVLADMLEDAQEDLRELAVKFNAIEDLL